MALRIRAFCEVIRPTDASGHICHGERREKKVLNSREKNRLTKLDEDGMGRYTSCLSDSTYSCTNPSSFPIAESLERHRCKSVLRRESGLTAEKIA